MKKIFTWCIAISLLLSTATPIFASKSTDLVPVYSSLEEWEASGATSTRVRIQNNTYRTDGGYSEYVFKSSHFYNDQRIGYHPDFSGWDYWSGYYFSTSKTVSLSVGLSLTLGYVTVGISVAASGGNSGTFKLADDTRRSRPWVRADLDVKVYDIYYYDDFGELFFVSTGGFKKITPSDVQIFIEYKS